MKAAARAAERYGPWVVRGTDELLVDVAGTAHLFGGERAMLEDCRRMFAEGGWSIRAAVAGAAGAARGLARFAGTDLTIGTPDEVRKLPVEALRLDAGSVAGLRRVGLRCIGDLASRSRAALAERFGERLIRCLDRVLEANGSGSEPLGVRPPRPELRVDWEGTELLRDPASVEAVCTALLEKLCVRLRQGDLGARKMILVLGFDAPEPGRRIEVRAGRGLRDPGRWLGLFRERPEAFDPAGGVARLDLAAAAAEPFDPMAGSDREGLWERLSVRLGSRNLVRFRPAARHRPEAAFDVEPVLAPTSRRVPAAADPRLRASSSAALADPGRLDEVPEASPAPSAPRTREGPCGPSRRGLDAIMAQEGGTFGSDGSRPDGGPAPDGPGWTAAGGGNPRPLRLLASPEPLGVEGAPDDPLEPPAALRRRGGRPARLRSARGPERIVSEWWGEGDGESREGGLSVGRDYWQVETEEGARLWIYRDLHPGPARWFLHGLFP